jgi:hypothetical protein
MFLNATHQVVYQLARRSQPRHRVGGQPPAVLERQFEARKGLADLVVQLTGDAPPLGFLSVNRRHRMGFETLAQTALLVSGSSKSVYHLAPTESLGQRRGDGLEEVSVVGAETPRTPRVSAQDTPRRRRPCDHHADTADDPVIGEERRLREAALMAKVVDDDGGVRGQGVAGL